MHITDGHSLHWAVCTTLTDKPTTMKNNSEEGMSWKCKNTPEMQWCSAFSLFHVQLKISSGLSYKIKWLLWVVGSREENHGEGRTQALMAHSNSSNRQKAFLSSANCFSRQQKRQPREEKTPTSTTWVTVQNIQIRTHKHTTYTWDWSESKGRF